jgi:NADH dehydrogenase
MTPTTSTGRPQRVVILGGGFAGIIAARTLRNAPVEITLIDRTNHHLFQPLLYQVATAVLAPSDITSPIRHLLRSQQNTTVLMAEARAIDVDRRVVTIDEGREIPYDSLILATGARHSYFGHDEWERLAPGLKSIDDAQDIRRRFLLAFERAEKSLDPEEQAAYLTFVVIGAGPTGVELAGMIPEIAREGMRPEFRNVDTRRTRVILLEGAPRVLLTFPEHLSERAQRDLESLGVEVRTKSLVTKIEPGSVWLGEERIRTHTVLWGAGNAASPLTRSLGVPLDRAGRVLVQPDMSIPGHPEVFAAGDVAAAVWKDNLMVPGVAPAANQMGRLAAENLLRTLKGEPRKTLRYTDKGNLATIGRNRAVADFGKLRVAGRMAWFLWLFVHILYLVGFRNRMSVLSQWIYAFATYRRAARLIDGTERYLTAPAAPAAAAPAALPRSARPEP